MTTSSALALWLLSCAVFFYVLFLVVRAAVREGVREAVQQALRADLLRSPATLKEGPREPRAPCAFREAHDDL